MHTDKHARTHANRALLDESQHFTGTPARTPIHAPTPYVCSHVCTESRTKTPMPFGSLKISRAHKCTRTRAHACMHTHTQTHTHARTHARARAHTHRSHVHTVITVFSVVVQISRVSLLALSRRSTLTATASWISTSSSPPFRYRWWDRLQY